MDEGDGGSSKAGEQEADPQGEPLFRQRPLYTRTTFKKGVSLITKTFRFGILKTQDTKEVETEVNGVRPLSLDALQVDPP